MSFLRPTSWDPVTSTAGWDVHVLSLVYASITRLGFNQWRIDRDELMITPARGNTWRFESIDATTWQRVPEAPNPYRLVRQ